MFRGWVQMFSGWKKVHGRPGQGVGVKYSHWRRVCEGVTRGAITVVQSSSGWQPQGRIFSWTCWSGNWGPCSASQGGGGQTVCGWGESCPWQCCVPAADIFCAGQPRWWGVRKQWCAGQFSPPYRLGIGFLCFGNKVLGYVCACRATVGLTICILFWTTA